MCWQVALRGKIWLINHVWQVALRDGMWLINHVWSFVWCITEGVYYGIIKQGFLELRREYTTRFFILFYFFKIMEFETVLDGIWTYITEALKPFPPRLTFVMVTITTSLSWRIWIINHVRQVALRGGIWLINHVRSFFLVHYRGGILRDY